MIWLWIVLGVLIYIIIGGFVGEIVREPDTAARFFLLMFWPMYAIYILITKIADVGVWLAVPINRWRMRRERK